MLFIAPRDWSIRVEGPATIPTILETREGDSWVALVDVDAKRRMLGQGFSAKTGLALRDWVPGDIWFHNITISTPKPQDGGGAPLNRADLRVPA
jgi:hypothetical protein